MSALTSGLLWLVSPAVKPEVELAKAVAYTVEKMARPVVQIAHPPAESYPAEWQGIPMRPDRRILAHHIYLVTAIQTGAGQDAAGD